MQKPQEAYQDLNDVVFEGRNKSFGAYQLRKSYPYHLFRAVALMVGIYGFGVFMPFFIYKLTDKPPEPVKTSNSLKVVTYSQLSPPPSIERKQPKPKAQSIPTKAIKYVEPVVKPDEEVPDEEYIPSQEELADVNPGLETVEGADSVISEDYLNVEPEMPPVETEPEPAPPPPPMKPFDFVEQNPLFPGGDAALLQFLRENIEYPETARLMGTQGRVVLRFVVDELGCVKDVEVMKGIGHGCDEEAIRVLLLSPTWTPGMMGERNVPVRLFVNVDFILE